MKLLRLFRMLEKIFGRTSYFFEDLADARDSELHDILRTALKDTTFRVLNESKFKGKLNV